MLVWGVPHRSAQSLCRVGSREFGDLLDPDLRSGDLNNSEAGNIRFGLELRPVGSDGGMSIDVLGDVAGQEIELMPFDCFRIFPITTTGLGI